MLSSKNKLPINMIANKTIKYGNAAAIVPPFCGFSFESLICQPAYAAARNGSVKRPKARNFA